MDITQGEFKDFYPSSNGRNSRNSHSRLSFNGSVCSSLELLPAEEVPVMILSFAVLINIGW